MIVTFDGESVGSESLGPSGKETVEAGLERVGERAEDKERLESSRLEVMIELLCSGSEIVGVEAEDEEGS